MATAPKTPTPTVANVDHLVDEPGTPSAESVVAPATEPAVPVAQ